MKPLVARCQLHKQCLLDTQRVAQALGCRIPKLSERLDTLAVCWRTVHLGCPLNMRMSESCVHGHETPFLTRRLVIEGRILQHRNSSVLGDAWQNNPVEPVYKLPCFMMLKDHELAHDATCDMHEPIATAHACISWWQSIYIFAQCFLSVLSVCLFISDLGMYILSVVRYV